MEYDSARDRMRERTDSRLADVLNMTVDEVKNTRLTARRRMSLTVHAATDAGCAGSDAGLTCIDQRSLLKPDNFSAPVQVIDDVCRNVSPSLRGNMPIICEFGRPYF